MISYTTIVAAVITVISILLFIPSWLAIISGRLTRWFYVGLGIIAVSLPFETSYLVIIAIITSIIALLNLYITNRYINSEKAMSHTPFIARRSLLNYFYGLAGGIANNILQNLFEFFS